MSKARNWCFTVNNPESQLFVPTLSNKIQFVVWQLEKGESGTPHYQGYCQMKNPVALPTVKAVICETAHLEIAKGTSEQNVTYCTKEPRIEGPWRLGEIKASQGKRNDLKTAVEIVQKEQTLSGVDPVILVRYNKGLNYLLSRTVPQIRENLIVCCIVGPTGIGKSYNVHKFFPDLYPAHFGNNGIWFDGYCDQKVLLLDEYKGQMPLQRLLAFLDKYPVQLETKGGTCWLRANLIFICSNSGYETWYDFKDRENERKALERRLGIGFDSPNNIYGYFYGLDNVRDGLATWFGALIPKFLTPDRVLHPSPVLENAQNPDEDLIICSPPHKK